MKKGVGIHNQDPSASVALTRWEDSGSAVEDALDQCEALKGFDPNMKVFIKPNLVEYLTTVKFSPYGIITSCTVLEALVRYLKDAGAKDITIAEAALENKEFGCGTKSTYNALNYAHLTDKYGVKLIDLNDEPFEKTGLGGFSLSISKTILEEAGFFINVPALKTHEQTRVTLGFKNNKGCLNSKSKSICHHKKRPLDDFVARLGERLYPHLTLIDGIYSLENGPMHMGKAHRENIIIAGRDMFSCDCLGSYLMGFDPSEIGHLAMFAENHGRSLKVEDIDVKGLNPADNVHAIQCFDYDDPWYTGEDVEPKFFTNQGVKGFRMPHPGQTLCTGCSMLFPLSVLFIITASILSKGAPYDDYELLGGKNTTPSGHAKKTFLLGDCIIAANRKGEGIQEAIPIPGCPASFEHMVNTFNEHGIKFNGMKTLQFYFGRKAESYAKKGDMYSLKHFEFGNV